MSYLYILVINPLLVISFANIFSHSVGCLLNLLMVSSVMQKLLSLIRSHSFFFFLIFIYLAVLGLSCGTQDLHCSVQDLHCGMQDLQL